MTAAMLFESTEWNLLSGSIANQAAALFTPASVDAAGPDICEACTTQLWWEWESRLRMQV